jgi:hypothetical protein
MLLLVRSVVVNTSTVASAAAATAAAADRWGAESIDGTDNFPLLLLLPMLLLLLLVLMLIFTSVPTSFALHTHSTTCTKYLNINTIPNAATTSTCA